MTAETDLVKRLAFGEDLTGKTFGKRTVISFSGIKRPPCGRPVRLWYCRCICGRIDVIQGTRLKSGNADSCGCTKAEDARKQWMRHGHARKGRRTKTFDAWWSMLQRCNNPNNTGYKNYGGRGIKVSKRWMKYVNFYADVGSGYRRGLKIDRINNSKNYCKSNCRWTTQMVQGNNTRVNILITARGKTRTVMQWARITGLNYATMRYRFHAGWEHEQCLINPLWKR